MLVRIIAGRTIRDGAEKSDLGDGQIFGFLVEICLRSRLNPIISVGEVDVIEIKLQDLLLGVFLLHRDGNKHFLNLSAVGRLKVQEHIPGKLLRDGTSSLSDLTPVPDQRHSRSGNTFYIDTAVGGKVLVLDGDNRQLGRIRDILVLQIVDVFLPFQLFDLISLCIVDQRGLFCLKCVLIAFRHDFHGVPVHGRDRNPYPHDGENRQRSESHKQTDGKNFKDSPCHTVLFLFSAPGLLAAAPVFTPAHIYLHDASCTLSFPVSA